MLSDSRSDHRGKEGITLPAERLWESGEGRGRSLHAAAAAAAAALSLVSPSLSGVAAAFFLHPEETSGGRNSDWLNAEAVITLLFRRLAHGAKFALQPLQVFNKK